MAVLGQRLLCLYQFVASPVIICANPFNQFSLWLLLHENLARRASIIQMIFKDKDSPFNLFLIFKNGPVIITGTSLQYF